MDLLGLGGYDLRGVDVKNVILGKNGCGKSRCLKAAEQALRSRPDVGAVRYLSPERGGLLRYEPHVEQNLTANVTWLGDTRRRNQVENFRQQSAVQFRRLELLFLRTLEASSELRADPTINFDVVLTKLNGLLDRVRLERGDPSFKLVDRTTNQQAEPDALSSGESELISLGIECLVFQRECIEGKLNVLLIDEPDVHLHPDLQARFARFIEALVEAGAFRLIIATHSTALLGAMSAATSRLAFMRFGQTTISFAPVGEAHRRVLPVFGAHPLSNVFNQAPVLLVEGEDDERIWQQAVRSANGRIKVYPCGVEGIDALPAFEPEVVNILESVYDSAVGYSLRDRDDAPAAIEDLGTVKRMRLTCRSAENLLLSDDCLARLGIAWPQLETRIDQWLESNETHPHHIAMREFKESGFDRLGATLKDIRNDLVGLMGSNKPWEVIVGQTIASLSTDSATTPNSLRAFLGTRPCHLLLGLPAPPH